MGKGKLAKFADMAANPLVVEPMFRPGQNIDFPLKGKWHQEFFRNEHDIVLELGCGRGEYTVGLGRCFPEKNYIGVDIKGSRMWTGAEDALRSGMQNVGFLRTHIEFLPEFFSPDEVSELWLTFSDPQMRKATKRLSSSYFLERYRKFIRPNGIVHLKTDSNFLFTYTEELLKANGIVPEACTRNLYALDTEDTKDARAIQTYYEGMWRERGIDIKYLRFRLPKDGALVEPEVEIELDEYRSYGRDKNSSLDTHK
ncbi:MAG: tRNA (guanosine(46)-N7)-methyltransferase TrmB [Bacteroidales bacterium]|nr:tRNA (guanosine(46)-N7)-methyltransferase TrmB [Candidatus Physcousia equi]